MNRLLVIVLIWIQCTLGLAQSALNLQLYPTRDKISQSKISHFVQDENGYIWFGTWDGLMRFDGHETQLYKTYPGDSVHIENQRVMRLSLSQKGNIWVSTYGKHCYVFDPVRTKFCNPLAAYDNYVRQLYTLPNGSVWAYSTDSLLLRIEEGDHCWDVVPVTLPFQFSKIFSICEDKNRNEWILTDQGAYIYNLQRRVSNLPLRYLEDTQTHLFLGTKQELFDYDLQRDFLSSKVNIGPTEIEDTKALSDGSILLCQRQGVSLYHPSTEQTKRYSFKAAILRYTFEDSQKRLWLLGNEDEVYMIENGQLRTISYHGHPVEATTAAFQFAFEDSFGTIWVQPGGCLPLAYYNDFNGCLEQAFTYENGRRRHVPYYIRSGTLDKQNNLWGNVDEVGFCYFSFSRQAYGFVNQIEGQMSGMGARAMMTDRKNRLWVGWHKNNKSDEGGIALYDQNRHLIGYITENGNLVKQAKESLQANIYTMHQDRRGRIWLGTRSHGLYVLEPTNEEETRFRIEHYNERPSDPFALSGHSVYDILEDHKGRIWIGNYGQGLDLVEDTGGIGALRFHHAEGMPQEHSYIRTLCETSNHKLFIGHNNGLWITDLEQDSLVFLLNQCTSDEHSLSSNNVMHVAELKDGRIAVSTFGGGLNILHPGYSVCDSLHFEHHDTRHGDMPDVILATLQDQDENLWIMYENGLRKYTSDFSKETTFLQGIPCSEAIPLIDPITNYLYLASRNDLICLLSQEKTYSTFEPEIVFSSLSIHRNDSTSTTLSLTPADTILTLAAEDRNFMIQFRALDYAAQNQIEYAYRFSTHQSWIPLQNLSAVHMADIPGGTYMLEVRSTNADGVWSSRIARLQITIEPYFYETNWFKFLLWILIMSISGYGLYFIMHRIDERRKARMESQLTEAKVKFITEVTHKKDPQEELFIQQLMTVLEQNLQNESFSVEQAAAELGLSYTVLYRKVKALMDITPIELMRQMRIQQAQKLLTNNPNTSISEVAYACGFSTPQYFNRVFKEQVQCTPAEYRKLHSEASKME